MKKIKMEKGIIFPESWRKIVRKGEVVGGELRVVAVGEVKATVLEGLREILALFGGERFCLALSGGLDSSVLAALLTELKAEFTAITIAASKKHPDVTCAKNLARKLKLDHKICLLGHQRTSSDIYDDLFYIISSFGFQYAICADTADEMLGGYISHKEAADSNRKGVFDFFWQDLLGKHLWPMCRYAERHGVAVALPYLAAHDLLRQVSMSQRVDGEQGKIILRQLAQELGVPKALITRRKYGLDSIWEKF